MNVIVSTSLSFSLSLRTSGWLTLINGLICFSSPEISEFLLFWKYLKNYTAFFQGRISELDMFAPKYNISMYLLRFPAKVFVGYYVLC
jgi:hypothetical protein